MATGVAEAAADGLGKCKSLPVNLSQSVAALWAAGIGVAASAVASLITARAARKQAEIGAHTQLEAVRLQAAEAHNQEKKRRQQQTYAEFYTAGNVLRECTVDATNLLEEIPEGAGSAELDAADEDFDPFREDLHRLTRELWRRTSAVSLEGPEEVSEAAENLYDAYVSLCEAIYDWAREIMSGDSRDLTLEEESKSQVLNREGGINAITEAFMKKAQKVLE